MPRRKKINCLRKESRTLKKEEKLQKKKVAKGILESDPGVDLVKDIEEEDLHLHE